MHLLCFVFCYRIFYSGEIKIWISDDDDDDDDDEYTQTDIQITLRTISVSSRLAVGRYAMLLTLWSE